MKKIRKMICIATITLMACFACTACGTTYQEAVSEEYATDDSICGNYISQLSRNGMIPRHITKSHMQKILK